MRTPKRLTLVSETPTMGAIPYTPVQESEASTKIVIVSYPERITMTLVKPLLGVVLVIGPLLFIVGCGDKSPTAPTPPVATTPTPAPTPTPPPVARVTVAGVVTNADTNRPVGGATVTIAGASSTTDGNGYYSISGVAAGNTTMSVTASGYNNSTEGITVQNVDTRIDRRIAPLWTRSGVGDQVFDMPAFVQRVRVQAVPGSSCQNFIVRIGGRSSIINVILGTCSVADARTLDSTYLTGGGGTVSITSSTGVAWTFTQIQ